MAYTVHQIRFFAEQLMLKHPQHSIVGLTSSMSGVKVDLNPHQVDAALFALKSPLSNGVLLADEVGLGKTIEAGLVLAQRWSERKRKILLIVTASLRTQWRAELDEKFFIHSEILESKNYNKAKKDNPACNPFLVQDAIVICSYNFASAKMRDIQLIDWDLVIMDEAHKLRNVYKRNNVMGNNLKDALKGRKKLLLTATPLQNNLMELYGLVSIIDARVFGDPDIFRESYVNISNTEVRNGNLKARLRNFCKRTLRHQVREYVPYTNRTAILQSYTPSPDEEKLYNDVSSYLQRERLHAFPQGQRQLLTLIARKLLASSSMAIHGTLSTIIQRLNLKLTDYKALLRITDLDDYDGIKAAFDALQDELSEQIDERMTEARKSVLENLDEEVSVRLKDCHDDTKVELDKFSRWLCNFFIMQGPERVEQLDHLRFAYIHNGERKTYNLHWRDAEVRREEFLRRDGELCSVWISETMKTEMPSVHVQFTHSSLPPANRISFLDSHPTLKSGVISIDKLTYKGIENEEHLVITVITNDGTHVDDNMVERIMELEAVVVGECSPETADLITLRRDVIQQKKEDIAERNKQYFLTEVEKLDAFSEDLKEGLQKKLKALKKEITEKRKEFRTSKDTRSLDEMLEMRTVITCLEEKRRKMEREISLEEDRINMENEALQETIRNRLNGEIVTDTIMMFSFEIV